MEHLRLGRQAWSTFGQAAALEWLETNGLGGWAYGTVGGASSRYYHAVLAASITPPTERLVLLARLEEAIYVDGVRYPLYTNRWAGGHIEADGLTWLHRFALAPFPTWTYALGDVLVEKRLFMRHNRNTTVVRYRVWRGAGANVGVPVGAKVGANVGTSVGVSVGAPLGTPVGTSEAPMRAPGVTLELTPLTTCRSIHDVQRASDWPFAQELVEPAQVAVEPYVGSPRVHMATDAGRYEPGGEWIHNLFYPYELLRGEATVEDLYRPGRFRWTCEGHGELTFAVSTDPLDHLDGPGWEQEERERRAGLLWLAGAGGRPQASREAGAQGTGPGGPIRSDPIAALVLAADQFIARRASTGRVTVIAGYPWFTDWGRDTMIALPGLTLSTRRYPLARELLQTFATYERDGLIPNHFPEQGAEPLYNTADASLWFFEAVWQYLQATSDDRFVREEIYPVLSRIAEAHSKGTHFDIRVDDEGLLRCGHPNVQVTWMDARVDTWVVTPRDGRPVEIQALWHNALQILANLADRYGALDEAYHWRVRAGVLGDAFARFWNPEEECLYDLLQDDGTPDPSIRPNQLFALTLSHPLVVGERAKKVVDKAFQHLYTPYGLRSLSPEDPGYKGLYEGTRRERDGAYHQGTVWPWLLGPFIRAYLQAYGRGPAQLTHARAMLEPLLAHLTEYGLGSVAEIFDGDPPHRPRGCIAQAWSVAELLRLVKEEL